MPEIPDLVVYAECLDRRLRGQVLERVRVRSVFTIRTASPGVRDLEGRRAVRVVRRAKRIVAEFEGDLHLVVHLMLAGRFRLLPKGAAVPGRLGLVAFDFEEESLLLTEAGTARRAAVHVVRGAEGVAALDPGGADPFVSDDAALRSALARENHTLKRALTDGRIVAGIGNAYSDEILHRARLSPMARTADLDEGDWARLVAATRGTLLDWTERLRAEAAANGGFPSKVTAFRDGMAVHGRRGRPCPDCSAPVQRIVKGERESNYCPGCQTSGRVLRDRALSRVLHDDWPETLADV